MSFRLLILTSLASIVFSQSIHACGDGLYRVGKGSAFRNYTVPLPGNLLILAENDETRHLAQHLADAGHEVYVAGSIEAMKATLAISPFEVVIAPFSERGVIEAVESKVSYLPVAVNKEEMASAKEQFAYVVRTDDHIKRYLKAIHKTLKSRAS